MRYCDASASFPCSVLFCRPSGSSQHGMDSLFRNTFLLYSDDHCAALNGLIAYSRRRGEGREFGAEHNYEDERRKRTCAVVERLTVFIIVPMLSLSSSLSLSLSSSLSLSLSSSLIVVVVLVVGAIHFLST